MFLANWDSYLNGLHNYYVYLDPKDDKFRLIPWDLDLSLGSRGMSPGSFNMMRPAGQNQPLIYWLLDDPAIADQYRVIVKELATTVFTRSECEKILDRLENVSTRHDQALRSFLDSRYAYIESIRGEWDK